MLPTATRLHSQESTICSPLVCVALFRKIALNVAPLWLPLEALNRGTKRVGEKETHHNLKLQFQPGSATSFATQPNPEPLHSEFQSQSGALTIRISMLIFSRFRFPDFLAWKVFGIRKSVDAFRPTIPDSRFRRLAIEDTDSLDLTQTAVSEAEPHFHTSFRSDHLDFRIGGV
ncbi:hypothetical protein CDAR_579801 [Caerostris darwini]|uniref:Uncharacterized protein n=1 Tax=Caerostris darwini TaxID=1538125 RepID=A0AAV4PWD8_9ARAC|nr:hypothetical protein CDAR_579801 [Caerostris darwini]